MCRCSLYEPTDGGQAQVSLINEVHTLLHQLMQHVPVCPLPGYPDGWTFAADPDAAVKRVGINQVLPPSPCALHAGRLLRLLHRVC